MSQSNNEQPNNIDRKKIYIMFVDRLKKWAFHNFSLKLLAIFFAVILWAGLITQDPNLTRQKTFENTEIVFTGEESLKRNGLIVTTDLNKNPITVNFISDVPQKEYNNVKASNYLPRVDLSHIDKTGKVVLPIQTYSTGIYGSVQHINPAGIELNVDKYVTQYRIPVQYDQLSQFNEGYFGTDPYLDPTTVQVSGPLSVVSNIAKAVVSIDVSKYPKTEGIIRTSARLKLIDNDGNSVDNSMLQVTSESVKIQNILVTQHVYSKKNLQVSAVGLISGEVEKGYYIKQITITPSTVSIASNAELLKTIDNLYIDDIINVDKLKDSFTKTVKLNLPAESVYTSAKAVVVAVDIKPIVKDISLNNLPINIIGLDDTKTIEIENKKVDIIVAGPVNELSEIKKINFEAQIDVTKLKNGKYHLPIIINYINSENYSIKVQSNPTNVNITIKDK